MKEKLLAEMEAYFGDDNKRITHARRVLGFADDILKNEKGDALVVEAAAVLHDIGIHEAERKYGSTAGAYQEIEGPPIAERILKGAGFPDDKMTEVLEIIGNHHSPGKIETINFKILYDADRLVNLEYECSIDDKINMKKIIPRLFLTETGENIAKKIYLK